MSPKCLVKASVASIGKLAVVDMVFVSFFIITVSNIIAVVIYLSLMLPISMGIISVVVCVGFAIPTVLSMFKIDAACAATVEELLRRLENSPSK